MVNLKEEFKKAIESNTVVRILLAVGIFIIALLVFSAGVAVGEHKASFESAWRGHYYENFGGFRPDGNNLPELMEDFPNAHGAIGRIIKVELPTVIVEDKGQTEKVILINDDTKIEQSRTIVMPDTLAVNNYIVVIGSPNASGQIEAKFIRIIPTPPI